MAVLTSGRLPVRLTPLVGRDAELAAITSAAAQSRLLTLTGPGGTGKTRLALAAAAALAGVNDGAVDVAWVELAPLSDEQVVAQAVAVRLGVPETPGTDPAEAIAAHWPPAATSMCSSCSTTASIWPERSLPSLSTCWSSARPVRPRHQPRAARRGRRAVLAGAPA